MDQQNKRVYRSPARKEQASETRQRILETAHELLVERGYAAMTVDAVATGAGVSVPSVYAIFGSKTGLLEAIIDRARFGPSYRQLVEQALQAEDAVERLRYAGAIARGIYDAERSLIDLMGGASVLSPELALKMRGHELDRLDAQSGTIRRLAEQGRLKADLSVESAADILWTLTGRDIYRMLVQGRGWSGDKYQQWLADSLVAQLVS